MVLEMASIRILKSDLERIDRIKKQLNKNVSEPRWSVVNRALDRLGDKK